MMDTRPVLKPWNVFVPRMILCEPSGYLVGRVYREARNLCVLGIANKEISQSVSDNIVGYWKQTKAEKLGDNGRLKHVGDFKIILCKCGPDILVDCSLEVRSNTGSMIVCPAVCIFFNPHEICSSYILLHYTWNKHNRTKDDYICRTSKFSCPVNIIGVFVKVIQEQQMKLESNPGVKSLCIVHPSSPWILGLFTEILIMVPISLMWITSLVVLLFKLGMKYLHLCYLPLPKLAQTASIIHHLQEKSARYRAVLLLDKKDKFSMFVLYNCCGQMLLDICLGLVLIVIFVYYGLANDISSYILDWADDIARKLLTLVQWLMGSPAGLKLNAQLTRFLGHFFIYHIYLWTGYLHLLRNVMPYITWTCSVTGILGMTTQMCLVADVLSMLTLHIYCFYVYAAKIFSFQVYVMGSLWRLFRGKKWNVLRSRVDSASYNIDQLFFGTLLFTILLFLLPTTALYYAVFTTLRLLVLTVQGLLSRLVAIFSSAPVFSILLRIMAPELVAGSVAFKVSHIPEDENYLVLRMQTCQIPVHQLIKLTSPMFSPRPHATHTWRQFITHLATGKLIYPWIEPMSEDKDKRE